MYIVYDFIFLLFILLYLPYFLIKGKFHRDFWQRFGFYPRELGGTHNYPIWLHAVSVGEVAAIKTLWSRLREEFSSNKIIISTVTKTGNEMAKNLADKDEAVFYLPLDVSFIINNLLNRIKPLSLIIAETEIWPNLINACRKKSIPIILVNGRISDKAFRRYKLVRPIFRHVLRKINLFCVRTQEDKKRFIDLGADVEDVKVTGNMKYDIKGYRDSRVQLNIPAGKKIFVAGSTHEGEEEIILDVFKNLLHTFKDLYLIIAPRHCERAADINRLIKGLPVMVIDKIGILQDVYSVSELVFVGGSLVRRGGHNIIEPAVFAKPIIFGPHMSNFRDIAYEFLKNDAAVRVKDKQELEAVLKRLLSDERERKRLGENARRVVLENQGAVNNTIIEIRKKL